MSTPAAISCFALPATSPLMPTAAPIRSRPAGSVAGRQSEQVGGPDLAKLGEPVDALTVRLGDHPHRTAVLDHHDRAVGPFGEQAERLAGGVAGAQRDRGVVDEV